MCVPMYDLDVCMYVCADVRDVCVYVCVLCVGIRPSRFRNKIIIQTMNILT